MTRAMDLEQIIVVGGGPVGMFTALALHSHGASVTILENGPDEDRSEWRGSTIHPPTLEMLDELDLASTVVNGAVRLERMVYRDLELDGEASFDYKLLEGLTKFPYRLQFEQYKLVRLLRAALVERRIETKYEHKVVAVDQDDRSVTVNVETPGGHQKFSSSWVVAADGSHSTIRKLLQVPFPGFTYPFQSLVVATPFLFEEHVDDLAPVTYWTGPHGRFSTIRTPDIWRIALSTLVTADETYTQTDGRPHENFVADVNLLFGGRVDPLTIDLKQHQMYRTHQRLAESFRVGRIVFAGDAAHLSSTTGGMGLNSGIHDAYALSAAFGAGIDIDSALNAYALGRRRVAEQVIQPMTTSSRQGTDLANREARTERLEKLRESASCQETAREYLIGTSMLRVSGLG